MANQSKFYSNEDRLTYLVSLIENKKIGAAKKQAWEWIKAGVFGRAEFDMVLDIFGTIVIHSK